MVDHELEFGWLECGQQANAVMDDGRMLVVTRLADRTLAAIWGPGGDPRTMPDQRVFCLELSERPELEKIAILRRNEERLDARLTAVRTALDAAGVPEDRPYTEDEQKGLAMFPAGTVAKVVIPLEDRVRLLVVERDRLRDQAKDQTHDVRREVADLHAMLDMAGCASIRSQSFEETKWLCGEEIADLPLKKYDLSDRVVQIIAERDEYRTRLGEAHTRLLAVADERDAERQASIRMVKEGFHCADQMCTSRRMLDRLHERLDRERVPAVDVEDRWRGMNVEERLETLFAGWESAKVQALEAFKQQVDRDVDKFLAGFAWKEPKDG